MTREYINFFDFIQKSKVIFIVSQQLCYIVRYTKLENFRIYNYLVIASFILLLYNFYKNLGSFL